MSHSCCLPCQAFCPAPYSFTPFSFTQTWWQQIWRLHGRASWYISIVKPTRCTSFSNLFYFVVALYVFRTGFSSIIRSLRLYIQHASGICQTESADCLLASSQQNLFDIYLMHAVCTVLDSWWWTESQSETRRVLLQNKINLKNWRISLVLL